MKKGPDGPFFIDGGEGGIRTLDRGYLYTLSRRAPSTARTPLLKIGGNPSSHTIAPEITATVAPFRAWRSSQHIAARGPRWVTIGAAMLAEKLCD